MEAEIKQAAREFFAATSKLIRLNVIRTFHYEREMTKYLCEVAYGFEPQEPQAPVGYLGTIGDRQVLVRFNNSIRGFPVIMEDPLEFDELIVVLGPVCALRPQDVQGDIVFYRFTRDQVLQKFKRANAKYVGRQDLFSQEKPDRVLSLDGT